MKRCIEWGLSFQYLDALIEKQGWQCALTGALLAFNHGYCNAGEGNASLDRIDSSVGYVEGNVQFVTKNVNFAKQAMTDGDFVEMCRQVVEHARKPRGEAIVVSLNANPASTAA
ncbi:hypothetical protein [Mesorhizobium silamurunense]|uniref:hypothetical protein n=1 Tax=Mesorhizobium silamurunense TaxID=499528 RepID=UPI0017852A5A|nr:hypothetical protein [Mesorhizobium silamurunense]